MRYFAVLRHPSYDTQTGSLDAKGIAMSKIIGTRIAASIHPCAVEIVTSPAKRAVECGVLVKRALEEHRFTVQPCKIEHLLDESMLPGTLQDDAKEIEASILSNRDNCDLVVYITHLQIVRYLEVYASQEFCGENLQERENIPYGHGMVFDLLEGEVVR